MLTSAIYITIHPPLTWTATDAIVKGSSRRLFLSSVRVDFALDLVEIAAAPAAPEPSEYSVNVKARTAWVNIPSGPISGLELLTEVSRNFLRSVHLAADHERVGRFGTEQRHPGVYLGPDIDKRVAQVIR